MNLIDLFGALALWGGLIECLETNLQMVLVCGVTLPPPLHTHTQGAGEAGDAGDRSPLLQPKAVNLSPPAQVSVVC